MDIFFHPTTTTMQTHGTASWDAKYYEEILILYFTLK